jgi:hypothetical protein
MSGIRIFYLVIIELRHMDSLIASVLGKAEESVLAISVTKSQIPEGREELENRAYFQC